GGDACGPGAGEGDTKICEVTVEQSGGVAERGEQDHRGAVLIVVHHGDVEAFDQLTLDVEAPGGAEMSSRLMPPKEGARAAMVSTSSSTSRMSSTRSTAFRSAKAL